MGDTGICDLLGGSGQGTDVGQLIVRDAEPAHPPLFILACPECRVTGPQTPRLAAFLPLSQDVCDLDGEIRRQRGPLAIEHRRELVLSSFFHRREQPVERGAEQRHALFEECVGHFPERDTRVLQRLEDLPRLIDMGAFVTTAFAAAYPADVRVASHTSGGVLLDAIHREGMPMPSVAEAQKIRAPYQWHHGLLDYAVPFLLDKRFDSVLTAPHEGHLYWRLSHAEVATDSEVLSRVRAWYTAHGMF